MEDDKDLDNSVLMESVAMISLSSKREEREAGFFVNSFILSIAFAIIFLSLTQFLQTSAQTIKEPKSSERWVSLRWHRIITPIAKVAISMGS